MKYKNLANYLPANALQLGVNVLLNFGTITGDVLTADSSIIKGLAKYLQGIYDYSKIVNQQRQKDGKQPINLITKNVRVSENGNPIHEFIIAIEVNSADSFNGAIDPNLEG